jgi:hypothetical protein
VVRVAERHGEMAHTAARGTVKWPMQQLEHSDVACGMCRCEDTATWCATARHKVMTITPLSDRYVCKKKTGEMAGVRQGGREWIAVRTDDKLFKTEITH